MRPTAPKDKPPTRASTHWRTLVTRGATRARDSDATHGNETPMHNHTHGPITDDMVEATLTQALSPYTGNQRRTPASSSTVEDSAARLIAQNLDISHSRARRWVRAGLLSTVARYLLRSEQAVTPDTLCAILHQWNGLDDDAIRANQEALDGLTVPPRPRDAAASAPLPASTVPHQQALERIAPMRPDAHLAPAQPTATSVWEYAAFVARTFPTSTASREMLTMDETHDSTETTDADRDEVAPTAHLGREHRTPHPASAWTPRSPSATDSLRALPEGARVDRVLDLNQNLADTLNRQAAERGASGEAGDHPTPCTALAGSPSAGKTQAPALPRHALPLNDWDYQVVAALLADSLTLAGQVTLGDLRSVATAASDPTVEYAEKVGVPVEALVWVRAACGALLVTADAEGEADLALRVDVDALTGWVDGRPERVYAVHHLAQIGAVAHMHALARLFPALHLPSAPGTGTVNKDHDARVNAAVAALRDTNPHLGIGTIVCLARTVTDYVWPLPDNAERANTPDGYPDDAWAAFAMDALGVEDTLSVYAPRAGALPYEPRDVWVARARFLATQGTPGASTSGEGAPGKAAPQAPTTAGRDKSALGFVHALTQALPHLSEYDAAYVAATTGAAQASLLPDDPDATVPHGKVEEWVLACAMVLGQPTPAGEDLRHLVAGANVRALAALDVDPASLIRTHKPLPVFRSHADGAVSDRVAAYTGYWVAAYDAVMSSNPFLGVAGAHRVADVLAWYRLSPMHAASDASMVRTFWVDHARQSAQDLGVSVDVMQWAFFLLSCKAVSGKALREVVGKVKVEGLPDVPPSHLRTIAANFMEASARDRDRQWASDLRIAAPSASFAASQFTLPDAPAPHAAVTDATSTKHDKRDARLLVKYASFKYTRALRWARAGLVRQVRTSLGIRPGDDDVVEERLGAALAEFDGLSNDAVAARLAWMKTQDTFAPLILSWADLPVEDLANAVTVHRPAEDDAVAQEALQRMSETTPTTGNGDDR